MAIKNVAVAGATGNLGVPIVEELVKAGFVVTVLSRSASTTPPAGVKEVKGVDYQSVDSLKAALVGQDAVVSTLGSLAIGDQKPLVDAAVAAGIKRFVPSEFGVNTRKAGGALGSLLGGKVAIADYLAEKAKASGGAFTWTGISNGLFFDWGVDRGLFGFDLKTKTATIYDSGNEPTQTSSLHYVGRVVAAVLKQADAHFGTAADKSANQYLEVASFTPSQNDILRILEAETGSAWTTKKVETAPLQTLGEQKLAKGDFSAFIDLLLVWQFQDGSGHGASALSGNAVLDLPGEDLKSLLKAWIARNQ